MSNHSLRSVIDVEDTLESYIRFRSGARAVFYATNAYCSNAPVMVEIPCEQATLRIEGDRLTCIRTDGSTYTVDGGGYVPLGKDYWGNSHYACIQDFYQAILRKQPYQNDIDSVCNTM